VNRFHLFHQSFIKSKSYHIKRRRDIEDMRIGGFLQVRQAIFRCHKGASCVNGVHKIVSTKEK